MGHIRRSRCERPTESLCKRVNCTYGCFVLVGEHLESEEFKRCMKKEKQWFEGNAVVGFP